MDPEKRGMKFKKLGIEDIFIGLTILLGIILIVNILLTSSINTGLKASIKASQEKLKPAKIELAIIKDSKCSDCFDITQVISYIKSMNVNITKEAALEFDSKEGRKIISKYNIEKVPTVIATGEIDKASIQGLEKKEDALLLANPSPPYTNAATGKIEGRVTLYNLIDASCEKCNDLSILISQIKGAGVKISEEKKIASSSDEGKQLIKDYNIGFVPAIILSKEASAYEVIQEAWPQIGSKEADGTYVLRLASPLFINLTTGKLTGIVDIIYLADKSCTECYNVSQHKEVLTNQQSFAISLGSEKALDINDANGKETISKYNITQVPTVILSGDISAYPSSQALRQFFSVEKDGSYVFRKLEVMGAYKDITKNEVVKAQQSG